MEKLFPCEKVGFFLEYFWRIYEVIKRRIKVINSFKPTLIVILEFQCYSGKKQMYILKKGFITYPFFPALISKKSFFVFSLFLQ